MAREPRCDFAGAVHLVTNRGTAQTMLYRSDRERRFFLSMLGELEERFGVVVIAFVLMGNHYHLIVRSLEGRLAEAMRFLDGEYAKWFNAVNGRQGAFFQGRYDARLIDSDASLERAGVYVHLNPLRAGLVDDPVAYKWSSLGCYVRGRSWVPWLRLDLLGDRSGADYHALVCSYSGEIQKLSTPTDHAGDDWWLAKPDDGDGAEAAFAASDFAVAAAFDASVDELYIVAPGRQNVPRMVAIVNAARRTGLPRAQIATRYGLRTVSGVSNSIERLRALRVCNPDVALRLQELGLDP